mgnify:CR=1 FL=1
MFALETENHKQLGHLVWSLPEKTPGYPLMDEVLRLGPRYQRKWFSNQREHWLGWLEDYETAGAYGRKNTGDLRAKSIFNKIANPPMLYWLAEAVEVENGLLLDSFREVADNREKRSSALCAIIRKIIPFEAIEARAALLKPLEQPEMEQAEKAMKEAQKKLRQFNGMPLHG